jgi:secondary thiamine-phosphate synthase enzyme
MEIGLAHVFVQHTSCSLILNENADPSVRTDMETFMTRVVPEGPQAPWEHTDEGYDDSARWVLLVDRRSKSKL